MENFLLSPIALTDLESAIYRQVKKVFSELTENQQSTGVNDLINVDEAAKLLSVARPTMYGYIYKNTIPYMKRRGRVYFSKSELVDWLKSTRRPTKDEIQQAAKESLNR